uniref:Uncharacterized protein n=1 Tax=Hemiselmis andersenii TaxID=464988 RepID=A0A6T8J3N6_HEMAN|mmetsp:Transcript_20388/g.46915  ORF Transcript_20388/g.46915 Transcript_20388/m.46915 type:complete len:108 (+) Transcript_20388:167-490(+)
MASDACPRERRRSACSGVSQEGGFRAEVSLGRGMERRRKTGRMDEANLRSISCCELGQGWGWGWEFGVGCEQEWPSEEYTLEDLSWWVMTVAIAAVCAREHPQFSAS